MTPPEEGQTHPAPQLRPADVPVWGEPVEEEGVLASLIASVRDVFFPVKLPPLVLESKPIAVVDRMAVKRDPKSTAVAIVAHVVVIALILFLVAKKVKFSAPVTPPLVTNLEAPPPMKIPPKANVMGGGGGQKSPTPVAQGRLPKFAQEQITPPKAPPLEQPKIAIEPTVIMQKDLKMANSTLPNLGMPNSPIVGTGSLGNGSGTGIGSGNGAGVGAGSGGNTGGGAMRIGGGVSAPIPISMPDPEFSEEARKAKVAGNVLVYLWVDQNGNPTHVRVIRGIGMGLDEKAMEAVRQYKFKPARKDGKPVTVEMNVEVNFQIF
ncbi:Ferric siderophore transport system, periplasmic binding protein TonB [Granulicella sibirica]|uniref:Ferric siderophore transport system, periplasmic binding protein TonB n=1 Tax=Granulicella sibirica TaxID=2479048 RepID=A0A4V1L5T3_9BACT|nr:Ferric siderophore transport system, periplasmic binding protein TonB [Granulicella sibirica]